MNMNQVRFILNVDYFNTDKNIHIGTGKAPYFMLKDKTLEFIL